MKMKNISNKFLLVGDKFVPEMHLKQPIFLSSACGNKKLQIYIQEWTR